MFRKPTEDDIIQYFKSNGKESFVSLEDLKEFRRIENSSSLVSLDKTINEEDDTELLDILVDPNYSVDGVVEEISNRELLRNGLDVIDPKGKLIIILRFGLKLDEYMTFQSFEKFLKQENHLKKLFLKYYNTDEEQNEVLNYISGVVDMPIETLYIMFPRDQYMSFRVFEDILMSTGYMKKLYLKYSKIPHIHTLEEIGQLLGVTRERIRQVENKILRRLRYNLASKRR